MGLGAVVNPKPHCEIYELEESDSLLDDMETDMSLEEKLLRDGAIKTIDLRNRLGKKEHLSRDNKLESIIKTQNLINNKINLKLGLCLIIQSKVAQRAMM